MIHGWREWVLDGWGRVRKGNFRKGLNKMEMEGKGRKSSVGQRAWSHRRLLWAPGSVHVQTAGIMGIQPQGSKGFLRPQGCLMEQGGFELNLRTRRFCRQVEGIGEIIPCARLIWLRWHVFRLSLSCILLSPTLLLPPVEPIHFTWTWQGPWLLLLANKPAAFTRACN